MQILFLMDDIRSIRVWEDTSFALMLSAQEAGYQVYYSQVKQLKVARGKPFAACQKVTVKQVQDQHFVSEKEETKCLDEFNVVFMRKDPPFDMNYVFATQILNLVDSEQTLVLNSPQGLRFANEKLFITHFPGLIPETLVTKEREDIHRFIEDVGPVVIKPLDGCGGRGIFLLNKDDPNLGSLLEQSTKLDTEFVMLQKYVPEVRGGDKRILLLNGEFIGALLRVPQKGELRSNMHVGGKAEPVDVTERDRQIIAGLKPALQKHGLYFVGIDVIGDYLTEVNVTSPTGIQEAAKFSGQDLAGKVINFAVENSPLRGPNPS